MQGLALHVVIGLGDVSGARKGGGVKGWRVGRE